MNYKMSRWLRSTLPGYILVIAGIIGIYMWTGKFGLPAILLGLLVLALRSRFFNPKPTPFGIQLAPAIEKMMIDLGLMTAEEWKAVMDKPANPSPKSGDSLARNGLTAVTLPSRGPQNIVVHWPEAKEYTGELTYSIKLEFVHVAPELQRGRLRPDALCFMVSGPEGYEFGISVLERWWEQHGTRIRELGIVKKSRKAGNGVQLVLEILPYQVFGKYWPTTLFNTRKAIEQSLLKFGWQEDLGMYLSPFVDVKIYDLPADFKNWNG